MDKITKFQTSIKKIQETYAKFKPIGYQEFEAQIISDDKNGHYFLIKMGWKETHRLHNVEFHIDIKGDKIWIQADQTEYSIAQELVDLGIDKSDIVLAYHSPRMRPATEFAIA